MVKFVSTAKCQDTPLPARHTHPAPPTSFPECWAGWPLFPVQETSGLFPSQEKRKLHVKKIPHKNISQMALHEQPASYVPQNFLLSPSHICEVSKEDTSGQSIKTRKRDWTGRRNFRQLLESIERWANWEVKTTPQRTTKKSSYEIKNTLVVKIQKKTWASVSALRWW